MVITGRGTDINLIPRYALPRRMIRWAADEAASLVTVSESLKRELESLGVIPEKIRVFRNGVDLSVFKLMDRDAARKQLGVQSLTVLSVGHLIPRKGHDLVILALSHLPSANLIIVGEGPERSFLVNLAREFGVADRVQFLDQIGHERMFEIYNAADVLVLASDREGWPNVLLESMACGTPAVASNVWGAPEIITSPAAGLLLPSRNPQAIADSITTVLQNPPARAEM